MSSHCKIEKSAFSLIAALIRNSNFNSTFKISFNFGTQYLAPLCHGSETYLNHLRIAKFPVVMQDETTGIYKEG